MVTDFQFVFQKDKISIGRRKQATARVSLTPGTGKLIINNVIGENYLQYNNVYLGSIYAPLKLLGLDISGYCKISFVIFLKRIPTKFQSV